jgi:hypothetical protein
MKREYTILKEWTTDNVKHVFFKKRDSSVGQFLVGWLVGCPEWGTGVLASDTFWPSAWR